MADYTTLAKVRALLKEDVQIDETTHPTEDHVSTWITQVTARLDLALISGNHTSQATDATQLAVLDLLCAKEVAYMVLYAKGAAGEDENEWHREFLAALDALAEGEMATSTSSAGTPWSYTMDADEDDTTDPLGPKIRTEQTF